MINLMQQLQQWADEGLYDWDNPTLDKGFKWMQMGSSDIRDFQPFEAFRFVDSWEPFVQCVLDGTIQVWRPVEHYAPPLNEPLVCLHKFRNEVSIEELDFIRYCGEQRYVIALPEDSPYKNMDVMPIPTIISHWQPLPNSELVARLKGGES
jgi:hypothetical protein